MADTHKDAPNGASDRPSVAGTARGGGPVDSGRPRPGKKAGGAVIDLSRRVMDLVGMVYDAALDPAIWPVVLDRLADATSSAQASLGTTDIATGEFGVVAPRHDPDFLRRYVEEGWMRQNLHWQRSRSTPIGQVFTTEHFIAPDEYIGTAYYQEWAGPQGMDTGLGINVLAEGTSSTVAAVYRSYRRGFFDAQEQEVLAVLAPHIQRAVQLQHRLVALEMQCSSTAAAFDRLRDGAIIVDGNLRITFANRTAEALLAEGDGLRRDGEGIAAGTLAGTVALRALIACAADGKGLPNSGGHCTLRRREGRAPLSVLAVPLRSEVMWIAPRRAAAVLFVTDPDHYDEVRATGLRQRFDLTAAETAFLAEIIKGDGLQASADRLGVSLATARTHLRHVFQKTGTQRQAELVRLTALPVATLRDDG